MNDTLLGELPYNPSGTYILSLSALPNLTPGANETFFSYADNTTGTVSYSDPVALTVQVIAGASLPPLVAPIGIETLASSPASGSQGFDLVAYDGSGNSAVFWADAQSQQVYMLRLDPSGTAMGSPISLNLVQGTPDDVAMLPDGHFVIAWVNLSYQLWAMEFNADGTPYTGDLSQTGYEIDATPNGTARVAIAAPGNFAVVDSRFISASSTPAYYYQYDDSGIVLGNVQLLDGGQAIEDVSVAMDDHGAAVIGWIEQQTGQVMAQKFDQYGDPVGSAAVVNTIPNSADSAASFVPINGISVAIDEQGRYLFTWLEKSGAADNLVARRFLGDGTAVDVAEFQVNDSTTGSLAWPRVALRDNRIVITWTTFNSSQSSFNVFAQAYTWDNTLRKLGGNFQVPTTNTSMQAFPAVAIDTTGTNFIIAWQRATDSNSSVDSYFKRFNGLNRTPLGFGLDAIAAQPTPLLTIPAYPTANIPLGLFTDPNRGNWTFTLVSGDGNTDNGSFQIANGLLSMTQAGVTSGLKAHYSIRVRATPDVGVPVEQVFDFSGGLSGDINFGQLLPTSDYVHAAAMQPNGQFVVAGTYGAGDARTALARYNPDGTLDPSFGGKGEVVTNALDGFNYASGVAVQPNGQIVAIGFGFDPIAVTNPTFLVRYNTDGSLDTSFGSGGILKVVFDVNVTVVAVQDDGKIVIAGSDSSNKVAVWRYNADGTLDSTFGSGGKAALALGTQTELTITALAIQPNGEIVVAGNADNSVNGNHIDPFVARFLANGSPDLSLDGVGYDTITSLSGNNKAYGLAVQADGKYLLAGSFGLLRLTSSGSLDTTFNGTGVVTTSSGSTSVVSLTAVAVGPDGKILAVGSASNGKNYDFVFIRYTTTGALDTLQTKDLGGNDYAEALGVSPSGQIDIAGDTTINNGTADDFGLWQIQVPVVTGIASSQGLTEGGTAVEITGYNFSDVAGVSFGSTPAAFTVVSPTEIMTTSPARTGTADVTVTTANGTSMTSPTDLFTYLFTASLANLSLPTITYGAATTVISGQLLSNAASVPVPVGETVQVTLNGITQKAKLDGKDDFSTTFSTAGLAVTASPYTITFSYDGDANFNAATGRSTLTVTPATLTVAANDASRVYGADNPVFTDTITGFVNGDSPSVVSGAASLTTTATAASDVGSYPIAAAAGTLSAADYTFHFQDGTLTVTTNLQGAFGAVEDIYVIGSGTVTVPAANGVLANDSGPGQLTVNSGSVTGANGGTFVFHADGSFTYTPPANFAGFDDAQYTVSDGQGDRGSASVSVLSQSGGVVWKFYESVLGRDPDSGGLQYWINDFVSGGQTGDIAVGFFESDELLNTIVGGYYQQYLGRTPDAAGLDYWKGVWHATGGPEGIKAGFAASPEFNDNAGNTPDGWLTALYRRILNRAPDPGGFSYWQRQLAAGEAESNVALGFFDSPEAYDNDVTGWFNEYMQRNPTVTEVNQYSGEMAAGASDRTIEQEITNLPEYGANPPLPPAGTAALVPNYYFKVTG